jgi:hypothetical protein
LLHVEVLEDRCLLSTVTNLNDAGDGSLRQAILDTPSGGTVEFQPGLMGTIVLISGELAIGKDLTIAGPGADVITVSGNHASRVFDIATPFTVDISGLTIADGSVTGATNGGGISNGGSLTITASTVSDNFCFNGAGISNGGSLTITASTVSDNSGFNGGGILNGAMLTIDSSTLSGNFANSGGGIFNLSSGRVTITDSTLSRNSTLRGGGGIDNEGMCSVSDSTISGNSSGASGGGIYSAGNSPFNDVTVTRCTINGNSAGTAGGGIANFAMMAVTDSTLSDNSALFGGGIAGYGGDVTVISSTLSGNRAADGGGIVTRFNGQITARNTIAAGNTGGFPDVYGMINSQGHNLIGDRTGGSGYNPSDLVGTSTDPIDPKLGPLQDNGGPTFTQALLPGSPAINAGDPTNAPEWDQRGPGFPRVVNGMIDIGAYEHQPAPSVTCSVADSLLWPPNNRLVNVGLRVDVQPPDAMLQVQVYANDDANASDAADIGPDTLQLRAERQGNGRVYLIVVMATAGGQTAFDLCTVVVPQDHSPGSIARVQAEAAAAEAFYHEFQTAPPDYLLIGQGPKVRKVTAHATQ